MRTMTKVGFGTALAAAMTAGSLGIVAARAQDGADAKPPTAPAAVPAPVPAPAPAEDYGALVKSLGDADFAARTKAYDALKGAGAAARKALEEGAKSEDAQVRWSAGRLLREMDGAGGGLRRRVLRFQDSGGGPGTVVVEPAPADPGARPFGDLDFHFDMFDENEFRQSMDALRRRLEEMELRFRDLSKDATRDLSGRLPALRQWVAGQGPAVQRHVVVEKDGERTEFHQAEDGKVSVKLVRKGADGKPVEESYEAVNMDALQKDHPDAFAKVKDIAGPDIQTRIFTGPAGPGTPGWREKANELYDRLRLGDGKPVLGVTVSEVPAVLRTQLSLRADEGIVVEDVKDGTPAARLGLKHHDVILSVNGIPVSSAEDCRSSVGAVKEGGDLKVRVLRGGKVEELAGSR